MHRTSRAQSETIGVVLLVGVVVTVSLLIGVVILGGQASGNTPVAEFDVTLDGRYVTVTHMNGDSITKDEVVVVLQSDDGERYPYETFTELEGNGDENLDPGEEGRHTHTVNQPTVRVLIAHEPTDTVLYNRVLEVPLGAVTADFGWSPSSPKTSETITFDGTRSTSGSAITSYEWDFGADGSYEATGSTTTNTYSDDGTYQVRLRVTNATGGTDTITKSITVDNRAPTPQFTVSPSPTTADVVTFDASGSTDDDGSVAGYEWDLDGDGTFEETGGTVSRHYSPAGEYDVTLRVTDDDGTENTTTQTVTVETAALLVAVEPNPETLADDQGEFVSIELPNPIDTTGWVLADDDTGRYDANTTLPSGANEGRLYFARNDTKFNRTWAVDGEVFELGGNLANSGEELRLVNTNNDVLIDAVSYRESAGVSAAETRNGWWFNYGGEGDVINRRTDSGSFVDTDAASDWQETPEETYLNDRPEVSFTVAPEFPNPSEGVQFNASASSDSDGIAYYNWSFGDGTTETTTDPNSTHSFARRGNYTVRLTVQDSRGGKNTTSTNLTVGRAPDEPTRTSSGLAYEYLEADSGYTSLSDLDGEVPVRLGRLDAFDISNAREEEFGFRFTGYVEVPRNGTYRFYTASDDGSSLSIGGESVVDNDGLHDTQEASDRINLEAGRHAITVEYFEHTDDDDLAVRWEGPGISKEPVPASNLTTGPAALYDVDCSGATCEFNASESVPATDIDTYEWEFGDGRTETTTDPTVDHTYSSLGEYTTSLSILNGGTVMNSSELRIDVTESRLADDPGSLVPGVEYEFYDSQYTGFPDYDATASDEIGTVDEFALLDPNEAEYALRYEGYIEVPESGEYTFETSSDDGSRVYIGDRLVVDNGGVHPYEPATGDPIQLGAGNHSITVDYFDQGENTGLEVRWSGPSFAMREIQSDELFRQRPDWDSTADWDETTSEAGTVHEDFGDRRGDVVELGSPSFDRGGSGLVAYWPLDEDSGSTAVDVTGNGNDGTVAGGPTRQSGLLSTTAYDFDGSDDAVTIPSTDALSGGSAATISASAWLNADSSGGQDGIVGKQQDTTSGDWGLVWDDSCPSWATCVGSAPYIGYYSESGGDDFGLYYGTDIETGSWYHASFTLDQPNDEVVLYVNGTEVLREDSTGAISADTNQDVEVGVRGYANDHFDGRIEDVRVYDRVLSTSEVGTLFDTVSTGSQETDRRLFETEIDPRSLELRDVTSTLRTDTGITVTVESDPNEDGTFERQSDTITLDGSSSYEVDGLTQQSQVYRLAVSYSSSDPTRTPTLDGLALEQPSGWGTAEDWDIATSEDGVVHEGFGDRNAGAVELGYPSFDRSGSALLGYWPLDEDSGTTAADVSGSGYDGTRIRAAVGLTGAFGTTAYDFEDELGPDNSGYVELPGGFPDFQSSFSISAWIRTRDRSETGQRILIDDESNSGGYGFSLGDPGPGRLRFYSRGLGPISLDTGDVVQNDEWYHVVAVADLDAGVRRIYVDGTEEASDDPSYSGSWATDGGPATIGGETDTGEDGNRFQGNVDEVRVYDRALSATDVQRLHDTGSSGSLTTDTRTTENDLDTSSLRIENVDATVPGSTSVDVTVESDPDGDGTFEQSSTAVSLDSSTTSYQVDGLAGQSRTFRLVIEYSSSDPTASPTVDRIDLGSG